ncbi:hypothetical protein H9P43_009426 [Blastocladiella emersonii ATCC 22665]|nr:hypothetical protein H9P43_009426 [Blastocladiella emersonii ATCC 22665]
MLVGAPGGQSLGGGAAAAGQNKRRRHITPWRIAFLHNAYALLEHAKKLRERELNSAVLLPLSVGSILRGLVNRSTTSREISGQQIALDLIRKGEETWVYTTYSFAHVLLYQFPRMVTNPTTLRQSTMIVGSSSRTTNQHITFSNRPITDKQSVPDDDADDGNAPRAKRGRHAEPRSKFRKTHAAVGKLIVAMRATKVVPVPLFNKQVSQSSNICSTESRAMISMILFKPFRAINEVAPARGESWLHTLDLFKNTQSKAKLEASFRTVKFVLIDEISMVGAELFAAMHLRFDALYPSHDHRPFGGLHVLTSGDFLQFEPVMARSLTVPSEQLVERAPEPEVDAAHDGDSMQVDGEPQQQKKKRASQSVSRTQTDANIGRDQWLAFDSAFFLVQQMRKSGDASFLNVLQDLRNCYLGSRRADVVLGQHPDQLDDWSDQVLVTAQNSVRDAWNSMAAAKHARRLGLQPDEIFDLECVNLVRKPSATGPLLWRQLVVKSSGQSESDQRMLNFAKLLPSSKTDHIPATLKLCAGARVIVTRTINMLYVVA